MGKMSEVQNIRTFHQNVNTRSFGVGKGKRSFVWRGNLYSVKLYIQINLGTLAGKMRDGVCCDGNREKNGNSTTSRAIAEL
jgi:hypothetical protein